MTTQSKWAGAAHLEEIAAEMTAINTKPDEGSYLGIEAIVEEAIEHLLTSIKPRSPRRHIAYAAHNRKNKRVFRAKKFYTQHKSGKRAIRRPAKNGNHSQRSPL